MSLYLYDQIPLLTKKYLRIFLNVTNQAAVDGHFRVSRIDCGSRGGHRDVREPRRDESARAVRALPVGVGANQIPGIDDRSRF